MRFDEKMEISQQQRINDYKARLTDISDKIKIKQNEIKREEIFLQFLEKAINITLLEKENTRKRSKNFVE